MKEETWGEGGREEDPALKSSKALGKYKTLGFGLEFNVVKMTILP